jgi:hypothetical protein
MKEGDLLLHKKGVALKGTNFPGLIRLHSAVFLKVTLLSTREIKAPQRSQLVAVLQERQIRERMAKTPLPLAVLMRYIEIPKDRPAEYNRIERPRHVLGTDGRYNANTLMLIRKRYLKTFKDCRPVKKPGRVFEGGEQMFTSDWYKQGVQK